MVAISIGTFNTYNLFSRYRFKGRRVRIYHPPGSAKKYHYEYVPFTPEELDEAVADGFDFHKTAFSKVSQKDRKLTGQVIEELDADILAVQEVESLDTLKYFVSNYIRSSKRFKYKYLMAGNDPRGIDVGLLSKMQADLIRTHQYTRSASNRSYLFSRDCLEVEYQIDGRPLVVFVNHLKSMIGGRPATRDRRLQQSNGIVDILKNRFGEEYGNHDFVIMGDLNDYFIDGEAELSGIAPLMQSDQMSEMVRRLPENERWTYYYGGDHSYNQLDYIFLSKSLAERNANKLPQIVRRGMGKDIVRSDMPSAVPDFFDGITKKTRASDHAGVRMELEF